MDDLKKVKNYIDFDVNFTTKLFGFKTAKEYYHKSSSYYNIDKLKIPSFFINSKDDKLSPIYVCDLEVCG